MPAHHSDSRPTHRSVLLVAILVTSIAACASPATSVPTSAAPTPSQASTAHTSPPASTASPSAPAPTVTPGSTEPVAVTLTDLVEDAASYDGKRVMVSGSYVGTPQGQVLCELLLESYPPQAGGAMVELAGQLPQEVLDLLESTLDEPDLAPVTWGQVEVIGAFRAAEGALEVEQIRVLGAG